MRLRSLLPVLLLAPSLLAAQRGRGGGGAPAASNRTTSPPLGTELLDDAFRLRNIGPATANSVGRVQDIAIDPRTNNTWYVVKGTGGVWKTTNHGNSYTPIFDNYGSYSMCCLVIDQKNPDVLWLGTGENLSQRSVNNGDGIYKSTDAGRTWTNMGLQNSDHIGDIIIDPNNSDIVYVAAQGPLSSPGGDRGLYKTIDGGKTWTNILSISENTGVSDLLMDPRNSNVMYAATWQRRRHTGMVIAGGPESAIYKTTDGWKTKTKLTAGLPTTNLGHIGIEMSPQKPDVIYAWMNWGGAAGRGGRGAGGVGAAAPPAGGRGGADTVAAGRGGARGGGRGADTTAAGRGGAGGRGVAVAAAAGAGGRGAGGRGAAGGADSLANRPSARVGQDPRTIVVTAGPAQPIAAQGEAFFRSIDGGKTWQKKANLDSQEPQYYGEVFADPHQFDKVYVVGTNLSVTVNGGETFQGGPNMGHVDYHVVRFDPKDPQHLWIGSDGGAFETYDGGASFTSSVMPTWQAMRVGIDNAWPFYNVNGGAQDNGSVLGPSRTPYTQGISTFDWISIGGGDGMQARMDPDDPNIWYSATQTSNARMHRLTGESRSIRPTAANTNGTWNPQQEPARWHWDTQLFPSQHKQGRIYIAGAMVFRSENRGDSWTKISPDLTQKLNRDTIKIMGRLWPDSEAVLRNSSTNDLSTGMSFHESPIQPDLLWFGSDDGVVAWTEGGTGNWTRITQFPGVPRFTHVTEVIGSHHNVNTAYATFNNFLQGDNKPYIMKTTDRGRTWTSISGDLPAKQPVWNIVEDPVNPNLLFIGTDYGLWFTYDGGAHWVRVKAGLPTIAVRDIEIHRRENDLVLATFGRSFWVFDDYSPLRDVNPATMAKDFALLPMRPHALQYQPVGWRRSSSGEGWVGQNPQFGALVTYYVKNAVAGASPTGADSALVLNIKDAIGNTVRMLPVSPTAGLHRVAWDLTGGGGGGAGAAGGRGGAGGGGRGGGGGGGSVDVPAGRYTITLQRKSGSTFESVGPSQTVEVMVVDPIPPLQNRRG